MPSQMSRDTALIRRRTNIEDVAELAGVSTATVDRVLHKRGGVRKVTMQRVLSAAGELGYLPQEDILSSLRPDTLRLAFVLPAGANRYLRILGEVIDASNAGPASGTANCRCYTVDSFNPKALAEKLIELGDVYDGIAFMALDDLRVREAVNSLQARGVVVLTLISDLPNAPRAAFVGMDNRSAGRTAGQLMGRFIGSRSQGNKVVMFAGSLSYRGHGEREVGFRHILTESFPQLQVIGIHEGYDDVESNYRLTRTLLGEHPDIAGIYNVGGASEGIARALAEMQIADRIVFVGHGLTPDTRALLVDGTLDAVINVTPQMILREAVRIFANLREGVPATSGVDPIPISIVLRENL